jgi:hypothetical protein
MENISAALQKSPHARRFFDQHKQNFLPKYFFSGGWAFHAVIKSDKEICAVIDTLPVDIYVVVGGKEARRKLIPLLNCVKHSKQC